MHKNIQMNHMAVPRFSVTLIAILFAACQSRPAGDTTGAFGTNPGATPDAQVETTLTLDGAEVPTIGADPRNGAAYLSYFATDANGETNVYLVRRPSPDSAWSAPVRVNSQRGDVKPHSQAPAQVAVDPDGTIYVVWSNAIAVPGRRFDASNLYIARSTDGGKTFSKQVAVNSDAHGPPAGHTFHDVAVAGDGTVYVSWLDSREKEAARRGSAADAQPATADHAAHSTEAAPDTPATHNTDAAAATPATHNTDAAAEHMHGSAVRVASSRDFGRTFTEGVVVQTDVCPCCRTSLAVASDGTVYVAWRGIYRDAPTGEQRDIAIASSRDRGMSFTKPRRVHNDAWHFNGCPHAGPSLAVDGSGAVHAAWFTGGGEAPGLYYSVAPAGGEFGAAVPLATNVGVSQARLVGDATGAWVAWEDQPTGSIRIARATGAGELTSVARGEGLALPALASTQDRVELAGQGTDGGGSTVSVVRVLR